MLVNVLEGLGAVAAVLDDGGRLVQWTSALAEVSGRSTDELRGLPLWQLARGIDAERIQGVLADVRSDGVPRRIDAALHGRDGDARTIGWSCARQDAGGLVVFGVELTAVTEHRQTENALVARERELSAIYANVPGVVFYIAVEPDGEFRFVSVSETFLRVTGLGRTDVVGALVRDVIPPPSLDMVLERYREAISTGQTVRWEEVSVYPAGERVGEVAITPLFDSSGAATRLIGIVHDVTDRKLAETALRKADARKDEFLAALSHELRNPLTPIRNSLAILELDATVSGPSRRSLAILDRQVSHLVSLVDDLLDLTRITQSRIELRREILDLGALVRSTLEDHEDAFREHGIELGCELSADVFVHADPTRVIQVVGNLLGNALKFTPRDGRVVVSLERQGECAELRVRDTGIGIDSDAFAELFVPFAQARQSLDRSAGGLGLGLALVKRLVELHGGSVAATSEGPGTGAELSVRLPLASGPPPQPAKVTVSDDRRHRILVIEDNVDAAETVQYLLESLGHDVRVAHDGPTALNEAIAFMPEVVFCDLGLPGMSGFDVCRALRASGSRALVVALSGYARPADLEKSAAAGFDLHVAKPATRTDLQHAIAVARGGAPT